MRVLRLIARLNVGGPARHVVWLSEGLAREGIETLLVTGTVAAGEQDMSDFAAAHGVTPLVIPSMSRAISARDLITLWNVWRVMVRFRPDVVHTHTAKAGAIGRIAGLFYRRARFVHTYHGHVFHGYYGAFKSRVFIAIERLLARLTDRIVVLGKQQFDEIHRVFGIGRAGQFAIVPLGLDLSALRGERKPDGTLIVGIVGRVTAIKNHDLFLRVAALMGNAARFVVYGDGEERARLEQHHTLLPREGEKVPKADEGAAGEERVVFAGTQPANEIYSSLDIVALTSRNEGTPLALIEAMALGKPVISTAVGGVVDLLGEVEERTDGYELRERGITVASDDDRAFAAGLSRLLHDEPLRARLAARGKSYVAATHTKDQLVSAIIKVYIGLGEK